MKKARKKQARRPNPYGLEPARLDQARVVAHQEGYTVAELVALAVREYVTRHYKRRKAARLRRARAKMVI